MRRKVKNRKSVEPDKLYNSTKVAQFINYTMLDGKKNAARKAVYGAFEIIREKENKENPLEVFEEALKNTGPNMEVRSKRVGGANYQIPREVRPERKLTLSMRWLLDAARSKKGKPIADFLAEEFILASKGEGEAVRKRDNMHKMADANKAFAHFAW